MTFSTHEQKNQYKNRIYKNHGLPALVDLVKPDQHRVLDIGCGDGANMRLLAARGHEVVGITLSEIEAKTVREQGFTCIVWNITEETIPFADVKFDALVFSHVLEHLAWPDVILSRYLKLLQTGGGIYIALPNALQFSNRWQFLCGRFRYTEMGLMDRTHLRFFDFHSARQFIEGSGGIKTIHHFGVGQFPMGPFRELVPDFCQWMDRQVSRFFPSLFSLHIIFVGQLVN